MIYTGFKKEYHKESVHLYQMDCMDLMAQTPDKYYELAVVDPPYGLGDSVVNSSGRFARYKNKSGNWDYKTPSKKYFDELFRVSKNQIIWGGNYFEIPPSKCFLIWDKRQPEGVSFASCEFAWASFDMVAKSFYYRTQGQDNRFHPTQKPIKLYEWIFKNYAKEGDKILDTHGGSFSSAITAYKMGFDFTGTEIDEDYFNSATARFKKEVAMPLFDSAE